MTHDEPLCMNCKNYEGCRLCKEYGECPENIFKGDDCEKYKRDGEHNENSKKV